MFKKILSAVLAASMFASLCACGSGSGSGGASSGSSAAADPGSAPAEPNSSASEAAPEAGATGGVIKVAVGTDRMDWLQSIIDNYKKDKPDAEFEIVEIMSGSDMYTKMTMMMQSPQTCPDIISEDGFMINSDAAAGYLWPLDDMMKDWDDVKNFEPAILEGGKAADGKQYGIPFSTDVQGIWFNRTMLEKAGVALPFEPKNWDEVLDAAKKVRAAYPDPQVIPLFLHASKTSPEETSMRTFQTLLTGTDGVLYDFAEQKWIADKENVMKVLNFVNQVYNVDKVGAPLGIVSQQRVGDLLQSDYMKNEKIALWFDGSWNPANWGPGKKYEWAEGMDVWGYAKIPTCDGQDPGYTTISGGWTWAIPANANNKEGAVDFFKFLNNKESQLSYNLFSGDLAVRTDVMQDPSYLDQPSSVVKETVDMLKYTHFRPSIEGYNTISSLLTEITESVAMATQTPEEAYATFESELKRIAGEENVIVK